MSSGIATSRRFRIIPASYSLQASTMHFAKLSLLMTSAAVLTGCLVPEKFTAEADFKPDGSYLYKFDGTAVHAMVVMAQKKAPLADKDRAELKKQVDVMARQPGVKKFKPISDARYELSTEEVLPPEPRGMKGKTTDVFVINNSEFKTSRILTVTGPLFGPKDEQGFKDLGINLDGKIAVTLPKGTKVLEHNASGTPGMFNKSYTWTVTSTSDKPMIKFQLPSGS